MTAWYLFPLAFLVGLLFNLNPSCGSGALVWTSTQNQPLRLALLATIRIAMLALVGAKTLHRWQLAYQFAGAALLTAVGLAFVFVQGFHRPLLELVR